MISHENTEESLLDDVKYGEGATEEEAEFFEGIVGHNASAFTASVLYAHRRGIPKARGMSTDEWVKAKYGGYFKLPITERREVVKELAGEGMSQREIAAVVGVDAATVNRDLSVANATEDMEIPAQGRGAIDHIVANATQNGPPLLAIVDLETGEIVDPVPDDAGDIALPELREMSDEEKVFGRLMSLSIVTQVDPIATAEAALRYRSGSAKAYLSRAKTITDWHTRFVAALQAGMASPVRRVK